MDLAKQEFYKVINIRPDHLEAQEALSALFGEKQVEPPAVKPNILAPDEAPPSKKPVAEKKPVAPMGDEEIFEESSGSPGGMLPSLSDEMMPSLEEDMGVGVASTHEAPKEFSKKARQTGPASKLFMVIGGIGGLIELQKILPSLPSRDDLAVLVFQDMADGSVPMFSSAMDQCTEITISQLKDGGPILSSHCWFVNWTGSWKIACWENGQAIRQTGASSVEKGHFDIGGLISAASLAYGPNLAILALSGTDLDMKAGLEDAVMHGSHFWLQNQASALYPGPLEEIGSWELEEATVETEAVGKLLQRWCQGETLWQDF